MSPNNTNTPYWEKPLPENEMLGQQEEHRREEHLSLDPRPPSEINNMVLEPMYHAGTGLKILFPIVTGFVILMMVTWTYQMIWGLGVTGLNRPVMWALYIVNFVYFIGVGHGGTFISAALRVLEN